MNIAKVAERLGIPAKTIRFCEDSGPVRPRRSKNGYRAFREADLHKLAFLGRARALGFFIETSGSYSVSIWTGVVKARRSNWLPKSI